MWALPMSFMAAGTTDTRSPRLELRLGEHDTRRDPPRLPLERHRLARPRFVGRSPSCHACSARKRRYPAKPGAVEAWLAALGSPDGSVDAGGDELQILSDALGAWHATVNTESEPVRTCFRIIPPVEEDEETDAGADEVPAPPVGNAPKCTGRSPERSPMTGGSSSPFRRSTTRACSSPPRPCGTTDPSSPRWNAT